MRKLARSVSRQLTSLSVPPISVIPNCGRFLKLLSFGQRENKIRASEQEKTKRVWKEESR